MYIQQAEKMKYVRRLRGSLEVIEKETHKLKEIKLQFILKIVEVSSWVGEDIYSI